MKALFIILQTIGFLSFMFGVAVLVSLLQIITN